MTKKIVSYIVCLLLVLVGAAFGSDLRFSPKPNKAHLIQWRAWGPEVLEEAKKANKPILLSLSAVWCHWCHVMDETTYSDTEIIAFINNDFIPIRVDSDMRPDIDSLYNQGGWPSTVILTPGGEVITGGNYFPPEEMLARLKRAAELYAADKEGIARRIEQAGMMRALQQGGMTSSPDKGDIENIVTILKGSFDEQYGGFGTGEKFPNPHALDFLLSIYAKNKDRALKAIITTTLDRMVKGGIHDKIDGGFFRYTTKRDWSAPHYEKMLDVNAAMIRNYAEAYLVFGEKEYRRALLESVHYVENALSDKTTGAFYGSQDADESYYGELDRKGMKAPSVDKTAYADSTSLMISALVAVHGATRERRHLDTAVKGAAFLMQRLYSAGEGIFHFYRDGSARLSGMLSDNALFGSALLDLYNATGDKQYLAVSQKVGSIIVEQYYDKGSKQFRSSLGTTIAIPVTAGMLSDINHNLANYRALRFLGRLLYTGSYENIRNIRDAVLMTFSREYRSFMPHAPAYGNALLWSLGTPVEITILGEGPKVRAYLSVANSMYMPEKVVRVFSLSNDKDKEEIRRLRYPLRESVYLCAGKRCSKPSNDPGKFKEELKQFLEKPVRN